MKGSRQLTLAVGESEPLIWNERELLHRAGGIIANAIRREQRGDKENAVRLVDSAMQVLRRAREGLLQ